MIVTHIDDDVFPFSEAELRAALTLVLPPDRAAEEAGQHARGLRAQRQSHDEFVARVAAADPSQALEVTIPVIDAPAFSPTIHVWPELECLALLHALSPDLAARVDAHRARLAASAPAQRWAHDTRLLDDAEWRRVQRRMRRLILRSTPDQDTT